MSKHIHGNSETRERDRKIRENLRNRDSKVIGIPYGDLQDRQAMARHFLKLGRILVGKETACNLRDEPGWFEANQQ